MTMLTTLKYDKTTEWTDTKGGINGVDLSKFPLTLREAPVDGLDD